MSLDELDMKFKRLDALLRKVYIGDCECCGHSSVLRVCDLRGKKLCKTCIFSALNVADSMDFIELKAGMV